MIMRVDLFHPETERELVVSVANGPLKSRHLLVSQSYSLIWQIEVIRRAMFASGAAFSRFRLLHQHPFRIGKCYLAT